VRKIAKAKKEPEVKRMNLNVPVELHNTFKSLTAARGENMTDVILKSIEDYVKDNSPKPKRRRG
jgi:hypothetical protein